MQIAITSSKFAAFVMWPVSDWFAIICWFNDSLIVKYQFEDCNYFLKIKILQIKSNKRRNSLKLRVHSCLVLIGFLLDKSFFYELGEGSYEL